ncbi:LacI family DNA-binding transcriptional regulator [Brevundimonas intermedia]|uniref:LacI family DNA-binding transcriptional regulator n=1 Tax=Brevundimonas intermedia TaxID=74315 RepID=UPI00320A12FB
MPDPSHAPRRRPTIKDVALAAGVSFKTVSRVTNGETVGASLKAKVDEAISTLGYRPNLAARRMGGGRSHLISFIVFAMTDATRDNDGFVMALEAGMIARCQALGYSLAIEMVDAGSNAASEMVGVLRGLETDAIILAPPLCDDPSVLAAVQQSGKPLVRYGPAADFGRTPYVTIDDEGAAFELTRYILSRGHTRIGFVEGPEAGSAKGRRRGYLRALQEAGVAAEETLIAPGSYTVRSGERAGASLLALAKPPTAIFAANDMMAFGVRRAAEARGLKVPEDLSIAGFDNIDAIVGAWPDLTTIRQPVGDVGAACIDAAVARLDGKPDIGIVLPCELVPGATVVKPRLHR